MNDHRILILGGYGRAGYEIADLLLSHTTVTLTLAGRHLNRAKAAAAKLNRGHGGDRATAAEVDITNPKSVAHVFAHCDLVIVTVPFKGNSAEIVIPAAVDAGIDYVDINADSAKHQVFARQRLAIEHGQQIFLTEAGIMPGCPAVMVRRVAKRLDFPISIAIGSLMRDPQMPSGSIYDMVAHAGKSSEVYRQGAWREASPLAFRQMDFGKPQGSSLCVPVSLAELKALPEQLPINELAVYQAGINPIADFIFLLWGGLGLSRTEWGITWGMRLFQWANRHFTPPPYGITLALYYQQQRCLMLHHEDVYRGTAIPVVAAVQQILAGTIPRPWQGFMGLGVEPEAFFSALEKLGLRLVASTSLDPRFHASP